MSDDDIEHLKSTVAGHHFARGIRNAKWLYEKMVSAGHELPPLREILEEAFKAELERVLTDYRGWAEKEAEKHA